MEKYKVLKKFRDVHTKEIYKANVEIELSAKRAEEVKKNLGDSYLARIGNEEGKGLEGIEAIRSELESLGVSFHPNTGIDKLRARLEEVKDEQKEEG